MLVCQKCGLENPLGRVFCTKCGSKLDLSAMGRQQVVEIQKAGWLKRNRWKFVVALIVILAVFPILALIPQAAPIGAKGTRVGANNVQRQLEGVRELRPGELVGLLLAEPDVNAFLELIKAEGLKARVSVSFQDGVLRVRMVRALLRQDLGPIRFAPLISHDVECVPVRGGASLRSASIGQLPLPGPLRSACAKAIAKVLATDRDWELVRLATEVKAEKGRLSVTFKK